MAFEDKLASVTGNAANLGNDSTDKTTQSLGEATDPNATMVEGDTQPPYDQFENCVHTDFECKYKDNYGKCIFETCQFDNIIAPRVLLWYFTCLICKRPDTAKVEELRAPFCHKCVERMNAAEQLPHNCRYCGKSINQPAAWMFSGICDECDSIIKGMIDYYKSVGRKWWKT